MKNLRLTCAEAEVLMQDYLDGYLLPSQREALEEHLALCASCATELLRMKRLEEEFEESIPVEVPPGFGEAVISRLPRSAVRPPWMRVTMRAAGIGLAACMTLALVVLAVYAPGRRAPGNREVEIVFYQPMARAVSLAGDFNDWNTSTNPMTRGGDGTWRLSLRLPPGLYQYNFYVNHDQWAENPGTTALVSDGFGGRNALLLVEG